MLTWKREVDVRGGSGEAEAEAEAEVEIDRNS